jgi:hypothetical protein
MLKGALSSTLLRPDFHRQRKVECQPMELGMYMLLCAVVDS